MPLFLLLVYRIISHDYNSFQGSNQVMALVASELHGFMLMVRTRVWTLFPGFI
jgi:hypothetical protein